jgi:uncharacterized protein (TIGR04222 family)
MRRRLAASGLAVLAALAFPAWAAAAGGGDEGFDPLQFTGPHFLEFYTAGLVLALGAGWMIRRRFRQGEEGSEASAVDAEVLRLDPFETAYLAGGRAGERIATAAALTSLAQRGVIEPDTIVRKFGRTGVLREEVHPVEKAVYLATSAGGSSFQEIKQGAAEALDAVRDRLTGAGLIASRSQSRKAQGLGALPVLLWLALGLVKIGVGVSRGKPVGFLVLLCIATAVVSLFFLAVPIVRTRLGDRVLERLKREYAMLQVTAKTRANTLDSEQLVLALGLFGVGILAGGPLASVRAAMIPRGSSGCGSSCGGGCGGGDGGGGGGCGGGCGGCGGGD